MSDRGSFVTDYIYCDKCFSAVKRVLLKSQKHLCSTTVPHLDPQRKEFPIVAGKISGLFPGEEIVTMETELLPEIEKSICHKVRIAVLAEKGSMIFTAIPIHADSAAALQDKVDPDSKNVKIEVNGVLTAGYYNDMEAGDPVFIDEVSLSNVVKDNLEEMGLDSDFCFGPCKGPESVKNPLLGKRVKLILEIED